MQMLGKFRGKTKLIFSAFLLPSLFKKRFRATVAVFVH